MKNLKFDESNCLPKCDGIDVISYNEVTPEDNTKWAKRFSVISEITLGSNFENDPELNAYISKLSDQYSTYKGSFEWPTELKSEN